MNPKSNGVIPVAILGSATLDAASVDVASLRFGPGEALAVNGTGEIGDVNGDGVPDVLARFDTQRSGIVCGSSTAMLTGKTTAGKQIHGSDAVVTVGCR